VGERNLSVKDYYEDFIIMKKIQASGPFGEEITYAEGNIVKGAIGTLSKQELLIAEANENKSIYVITMDKTNPLEYDIIIKRVKSGQTLRITSNWRDAEPPKISSFDWVQVNAEKFEIPK